MTIQDVKVPSVKRLLRELLKSVERHSSAGCIRSVCGDDEDAAVAWTGVLLFAHQWLRSQPAESLASMIPWLKQHAAAPLGKIIEAVTADLAAPGLAADCAAYLARAQLDEGDIYENVLAALDPSRRRRHGFYCTPTALAEFVVARAEAALLQSSLGPRGILDPAGSSTDPARSEEPLNRLKILDPAVGTGVFLEAVIRAAHRRHIDAFPTDRRTLDATGHWSAAVAERLLPSMTGYDIQLGPLICAHLRLACCLAQCGFDFRATSRLALRHQDALSTISAFPQASSANDYCLIVGNPPYGAVQAAPTPTIRRLMHGQWPGKGGSIDYFQSAEGPIRERKTWLYDQYVRFLRFAQWRVAQARGGVIAMLTNRGFLHHLTMRGLRYQWLRTFQRIEIHDLQGGSDRSCEDMESLADNPFGVRSGVAISILTHDSQSTTPATSIELFEHQGRAARKLERIRLPEETWDRPHRITPKAPGFVFARPKIELRPTASVEWRLDDCFVRKSSAIVTARDSLVIAFERQELLARIGLLRQSDMDDESLRKRFFPRSRSHRFLRGDTRSWKLSEARVRLAADPQWTDHVQRCCYRPLDDRWLYWHPAMIDWPRTATTRQMLSGENPALLGRRQATKDSDALDFWVTRWPTLDGLLRSDNRGNEFVFPFRDHAQPHQCNLSPQFLEHVERELGQTIDRHGSVRDSASDDERLSRPLTTWDVFAYLVALTFSRSHRCIHRESARDDFIPVHVVSDPQIFRQLASHGRRLIEIIGWHEIGTEEYQHERSDNGPAVEGRLSRSVMFQSGTIAAGGIEIARDVSPAIWDFRVGNHALVRKWLAARRGLPWTRERQVQFSRLLDTVKAIQTEIAAIDSSIQRANP